MSILSKIWHTIKGWFSTDNVQAALQMIGPTAMRIIMDLADDGSLNGSAKHEQAVKRLKESGAWQEALTKLGARVLITAVAHLSISSNFIALVGQGILNDKGVRANGEQGGEE